MCKITIFTLCFLLYESAISSSSFDQRQSGDVNVQVDLKNVQIIALMKGKEDYVDYDYAYDYSEMTIKPQNTTKKPLNVTNIVTEIPQDNATVATTVFTEQITERIMIKMNNTSLTTGKDEVTFNPTVINAATTRGVADISTTTIIPDSSNNKNISTASTSTNCKNGFIQNSRGNCELKLQNTSNALLKILKLSQKLKLRRENRRNEEDSI